MFQSTRPVRDATIELIYCTNCKAVSIHASRAGRDPDVTVIPIDQHRFNPRVPCGTRRSVICSRKSSEVFQSTRPVRDATMSAINKKPSISVSIHASRAGRDIALRTAFAALISFNPRVPCGTRQWFAFCWHNRIAVSIHASRAGRDLACLGKIDWSHCFNPRVPCGTRLGRLFKRSCYPGFNPRVPCGTRPSAACLRL